jgi:hypothetical protein
MERAFFRLHFKQFIKKYTIRIILFFIFAGIKHIAIK